MGILDKARAIYRLMAPGTHMPVYVMMNVTHRCDAKCGHCFFWKELNTAHKNELTAEEIDKLARSIGPALQVTLTGGSPELRKDLPVLAQSFIRHCKPAQLTICMNGYHTENIIRHVTDICRSAPKQKVTIGISLDGIGEAHDKLRGMKGLFDNVLRTINGLVALRQTYPNLKVATATVVSGLNYQNAVATAHWARENLPLDTVKPILVRGDPWDANAMSAACLQEYIRIVDDDDMWLKKGCDPSRSAHDLLVTTKEMIQRRLISSIARTGKSPVHCSATQENIVIRANGDVPGCEIREKEIIGNLRDYDMDVRKLWVATKARAFRQTIRREKCACYHHCFLAPAIFRTPSQWPRLAMTAASVWYKSWTSGRSTQFSKSMEGVRYDRESGMQCIPVVQLQVKAKHTE